MAISDKITNMFQGIHALLYLFCASMAFVATYPFYQIINDLEMSTTANVTITLVFWIMSFTVVYMGTIWVFKGYGQETPYHRPYGLRK